MKILLRILVLLVIMIPTTLLAATYYVSTTGTGNCTGQSNSLACNSIQRAISLAQPGDQVIIAAGTYIESSATSAYTSRCGWFDPMIASLCIVRSGTPGNPIVIRAAAGSERQVILNNQNLRLGIQIGNHDYLEINGIRFINNKHAGIANYSQVQNQVPNQEGLSKGVTVRNCDFIYTEDEWGSNPSAIAMWASDGWLVENNFVDTVIQQQRSAAGIMAYGVINATIRNNTVINTEFGIFWKDHFVADVNRTLVQESNIYYNRLLVSEIGVRISISGSGSPEAGHTDIHHNIIRAPGGVESSMVGAFGISGNLVVRNNLFDGQGIGGSLGITADSHISTTITGNIILDYDVEIDLPLRDPVKNANLVLSNRNVFTNEFQAIVDRYSTESNLYGSLADWRLATEAQVTSFLNYSFPDVNSVAAARGSIINTDYTLATNSPARNLLAAGRNAGPYEYGNEVIGLTSAPVEPQVVAPNAPLFFRIR